MAKILIIIVSGPEADLRAKEGLSQARAIQEIGMAEAVELLLTGSGVRCLSTKDPDCVDLREELERAILTGVPVSACTGSLAEYQLLDEVEALEKVKPVGTPTFLSSKVDEGFAMISF